VIGSNGGTPETRAVLDGADLVMFVGCRAGSVTTERWRHPRPDRRILHIDLDPAVLGANYRTEVAILSDARLALVGLAKALSGGAHPGAGAAAVAEAKGRKFAAFRALAESRETPIRPERVVAELAAVAPEDAVIIADPGTPCPYFSAYYEFCRPGRHYISNRAHGALGYSLPAVVGASFARPGAKCIAVMGDGAFGFAAGELETIARLGLPVTLIVLSNSSYGWIRAGQRTGFGGRFYSVDFTRTDHAKVAQAYGLAAWRISEPEQLRPVLAAAIESSRPSLVDIVTQPLDQANAPVSEWVA